MDRNRLTKKQKVFLALLILVAVVLIVWGNWRKIITNLGQFLKDISTPIGIGLLFVALGIYLGWKFRGQIKDIYNDILRFFK